MGIDPELEEILVRWDEQRDEGGSPSLEELCREHPEWLAEARRLTEGLRNLDALIEDDRDGSTHEDPHRQPGWSLEDISVESRCRVVRLHARGGLGEVYVAWDRGLRREVALKLIQNPLARDSGRRQRFLREAEITARLGHPGIVPVFGLGHTRDGRPCYTMRYIEGETLRAAIVRFHAACIPRFGRGARARTLALRGLISRLVAVCQAVAYAHSRGVIHRDLKPDNVMLGPFQETLVVDWGLAKQTRGVERCDEPTAVDLATIDEDEAAVVDEPDTAGHEDDSLTRAGSTLGTPADRSPEQAEGRWDQVGPASDVYGLGATLYFLLTGRPAFEDRSRSALLDRVRRGDFAAPRQVKEGTPRALEAICLKAMALRPGDRYAGVLELASDLDRWLADEPTTAWREPWPVRLGRWIRRHRPLVAGTAALATTALIALSLSTLLLGREQARTKLALRESQRNYRLARTTMADVQTSFGFSAAERQAPAEAALWFAEAAATADVDPARATSSKIRTRGFCLESPAPAGMIEFPPVSGQLSRVNRGVPRLVFDGTGRYLLAISKRGTCVIQDVLNDRPVPYPGGPRVVTAAAWSRSGSGLLALAAGKTVELFQVPEARVVERLKRDQEVSALEFSRDGRLLAIGGESARVWDLQRKAYLTPEFHQQGRILELVLNTRADRLAVTGADGRVWVYELGAAGTTPLFQAELDPTGVLKRPFRPLFVENDRGVLTLKNGELEWRNAITGKVQKRLKTELMAVYNVLLSPDGRAITATGLGGVRSWDSTTGELLGSFGDTGFEAAAYTTDGTWLLLSNGYYLTTPHRFPDGLTGGWVLRHQDLVATLATSADGRHFAVAQDDDLVQVWKLTERLPDRPLPKKISSSVRLAMGGAEGRLVMPLGKYFTSGPSSTQVHDLTSERAGPEIRVNGILHGGAIAPNGRQVVTLSSPPGKVPPGASELQYRVGSSKGWIGFWDGERGSSTHSPLPTPSEPFGAAYAPDGRRLAVICARGEFLWVDPLEGRILTSERAGPTSYRPGVPCEEVLRFSSDGRHVVHWDSGTPVLRQVSLWSGSGPLPTLRLDGNHPGVLDARFSHDNRYLATAGMDKSVRVWDVASGRKVGGPLAHPDWIFQVGFNEDGSRLLTGCRDKSARVWDWRGGRLEGPPLTHQGEVQDVCFLNHGQWVLTKCSVRDMANSGENALQIWDWSAGKPLTPSRLLVSAWGSQLQITPDGRRAVLGGLGSKPILTVDLKGWVNLDDPRFASDRLRQIAELHAGQKLVGGSSLVRLTTPEWVERWKSYRQYRHEHQDPARSTRTFAQP